MIISAEQLHALIALAGTRKIEVAEITGTRPLTITLTPGEEVLAQVMARLPSGSHLVGIKGGVFSMTLPLPLPPGESVRLTYLGSEGRPLFAFSKGAQAGVPVDLSPISRLIGQILTGDTPSAPTRGVRLLESPPDPSHSIAPLLKERIRASGLFYEHHLLLWSKGRYPLDLLLQEPQGELSRIGSRSSDEQHPPPPRPTPDAIPDPRTTPLVREQLSILSSRSFGIGGEYLPGIPFRLSVEEREGEGQRGDSPPTRWRSRLSLTLPRLGTVEATLDLSGKEIVMDLTTQGKEAADFLEKGREMLEERMAGRGFSLTLRIGHE